MNVKRLLLGFVLADFAALNAYVVYEYGYLGFINLVLANAATVAAMVDLVIALSLVLTWMWTDARARGVTILPYLAITAVFGSVGPLLYLVLRPDEPQQPATLARAA